MSSLKKVRRVYVCGFWGKHFYQWPRILKGERNTSILPLPTQFLPWGLISGRFTDLDEVVPTKAGANNAAGPLKIRREEQRLTGTLNRRSRASEGLALLSVLSRLFWASCSLSCCYCERKSWPLNSHWRFWLWRNACLENLLRMSKGSVLSISNSRNLNLGIPYRNSHDGSNPLLPCSNKLRTSQEVTAALSPTPLEDSTVSHPLKCTRTHNFCYGLVSSQIHMLKP